MLDQLGAKQEARMLIEAMVVQLMTLMLYDRIASC